MKQIDMIIWQLDTGDLEKPFDINDREVHIRTRIGPAARPRKPSSGPIRKVNLATLTAPTPTPQSMEIDPLKVPPSCRQSILQATRARLLRNPLSWLT